MSVRGKGKKSMASALSASLKAEDRAVKDRFERAEALLGDEKAELQREKDTKRTAHGGERGFEMPEPSSPPVSSPSEPEPERKSKKRQQTVRDNFTFPQNDYELIASLKERCLQQAVSVSKSEIIRAGLHALESMSDPELLELIENLEKLKTGRPPSK